MAEGTERSFDRVVSFSDAVVAIAITLLILPVVDGVTTNNSLDDLLSGDRNRIYAFLLSFAVIAELWMVHHRVLDSIERSTTPLLWANMTWLATVVFLPVPTEVLAVHSTSDTSVRFFYIASVLANSIALLAIQIVVVNSPKLWVPGRRPDSVLPGLVTVAALLVALIIGTLVPAIGLWSMTLLIAAGPVGVQLVRAQQRRLHPPDDPPPAARPQASSERS